jgi:hypothetical protein
MCPQEIFHPRSGCLDKDVPGLCLRITETGHKSWGLYYRFAGRQQRLSLGRLAALSLKQARKKARSALNDVAEKRNPFTAKIEERNAETFKAITEEYIDAIQRGELRLDLLFHNNEKEIALLGQHPAILWKLENVRMHRLDHEMD